MEKKQILNYVLNAKQDVYGREQKAFQNEQKREACMNKISALSLNYEILSKTRLRKKLELDLG